MSSLARQLERSAAANKSYGSPFRLVATNFSGTLADASARTFSHSWQMDLYAEPAHMLLHGAALHEVRATQHYLPTQVICSPHAMPTCRRTAASRLSHPIDLRLVSDPIRMRLACFVHAPRAQLTRQCSMKMQVVVLSPDAERPLEDVRADTVYVVGGIIDRTIEKYRTAMYASKHGFQVRTSTAMPCHNPMSIYTSEVTRWPAPQAI